MVSTFKSVTSSSKYKDVEVLSLLEVIDSNKLIKTTEKARELIDTYGRKSTQYADYKKKLPCVTWSSKFNTIRKEEDLESLSGLIYLDFDEQYVEPDEYTYAQWYSLSGTGIGRLVKVDGLTKTNFKSTCESLHEKYPTCDNLKDYARLNILSHSNLYFNENSKSYKAVERKIELRPNIITIDTNSNNYIDECCNFAINIAKKNGYSFTQGSRHLSAVSYFGATNVLGVELYSAIWYLNNKYYFEDNERIGLDVYKRYSNQHCTFIKNK